MEKVCASSANRSRYCPARWTSWREKSVSERAFGDFVGDQRHSLRGGLHVPAVSGAFHRPSKKRLAAAIFLPKYPTIGGRAIRGEVRAGIRSYADFDLRQQPRKPVRPICNLLGDSAIRAWLRAGVPLQGANLRLDDEALRKHSGAGCARKRRTDPDARAREDGAGRRNQPDRLPRTLTYPHRPHARIRERDFQPGAQIRRADRADEHSRLVPIFPNRQLDAVPREDHRADTRSNRDEGRGEGRRGRTTRASARDYFGAGGRIAAREPRSESLRGVRVGK